MPQEAPPGPLNQAKIRLQQTIRNNRELQGVLKDFIDGKELPAEGKDFTCAVDNNRITITLKNQLNTNGKPQQYTFLKLASRAEGKHEGKYRLAPFDPSEIIGSGVAADAFMRLGTIEADQGVLQYKMLTGQGNTSIIKRFKQKEMAATEQKQHDKLDHLHSKGILTAGSEQKSESYIQIRYAGSTLTKILEKPLNFQQRQELAMAVLEAYDQQFAMKNHAHLDIKPDNIVVSYDPKTNKPRVTFIDLGLAAELNQPISRFDGTKLYMSPEAIGYGPDGKVLQTDSPLTATFQQDAFALGRVLTQVYGGEGPENAFKGNDPYGVKTHQWIENSFNGTSEKNAFVPHNLFNGVNAPQNQQQKINNLITQTLNPDPAQRPTSIASMKNQLREPSFGERLGAALSTLGKIFKRVTTALFGPENKSPPKQNSQKDNPENILVVDQPKDPPASVSANPSPTQPIVPFERRETAGPMEAVISNKLRQKIDDSKHSQSAAIESGKQPTSTEDLKLKSP